MEDNCQGSVENNDRMDNVAKITYLADAHLKVTKNQYRPTIQYGLMPQASKKIKGTSE